MIRLPKLPTTATAPFCPSEVQGSIKIPAGGSFWTKLRIFLGPGLLVSVGYMDPGNWATDIEAGSKYGYSLLFVVALSSLAAMLLQTICVRVGLVTGKDLAQLSRENFSPSVNFGMWLMAELAVIMTDVAEVLGAGLALHLLTGCSLEVGILVTALDTFIVLGFKGRGFRQVEAIILGLVTTIALCYVAELFLIKPEWQAVWRGFFPDMTKLKGPEPWYIAIGILGATVMPHNLYLHSSLVKTRLIGHTVAAKREAIQLNGVDTTLSLTLAFAVNAAILILAGTAFHNPSLPPVSGIEDAYQLLTPMVGGSIAAILFAIALLASGQSATFTGTIAGQIVMEGFMKWKIPCWQRRLLTRALALAPALAGVILLGDHSVNKMLVLSQVVLSLQLPFAIFPLLRFASSQNLMGVLRISGIMKFAGWTLFLIITIANLAMLIKQFY